MRGSRKWLAPRRCGFLSGASDLREALRGRMSSPSFGHWKASQAAPSNIRPATSCFTLRSFTAVSVSFPCPKGKLLQDSAPGNSPRNTFLGHLPGLSHTPSIITARDISFCQPSPDTNSSSSTQHPPTLHCKSCHHHHRHHHLALPSPSPAAFTRLATRLHSTSQTSNS